jgi:hypothetical protein
VVCNDAGAAKQHAKVTIAESPPLGSEPAQLLQQWAVIESTRNASERFTITGCDCTGLGLAQPELFHDRPSNSSPLRGR